MFVVRLPGQLCVKTAAEHACSVHISHRGQNSWSHPWLCPHHMQQNNGGCACRQSARGRGNMHGLCPNCVVRHLLPRFSCSHRGGSSWSLPWLPPPTCSNITQSNILSGCIFSAERRASRQAAPTWPISAGPIRTPQRSRLVQHTYGRNSAQARSKPAKECRLLGAAPMGGGRRS